VRTVFPAPAAVIGELRAAMFALDLTDAFAVNGLRVSVPPAQTALVRAKAFALAPRKLDNQGSALFAVDTRKFVHRRSYHRTGTFYIFHYRRNCIFDIFYFLQKLLNFLKISKIKFES
jgi:hypothetical protein